MEAKDSIVIAGSLNKYARSTDYGDTWETHYFPDTIPDVGALLDMVQYKDTIYAATQFGVFASKDWGISWEMRGENIQGASSANVCSIDMLDTIIMIGTNYGVHFSYCYGGTGLFDWKIMFHNESGISELYNVEDSLLLFGNNYGSGTDFFYSADTGKTWKQFYLQKTSERIAIYGFLHDEKYFYALTNSGVWRYLRDTNVNNNKLHEGYTKPNNILIASQNEIYLNINSKSNVAIDVYTVSGRKVLRLLDKIYQKGRYQIKVENYFMNLSNGVYLLRITINGKINLLKWQGF